MYRVQISFMNYTRVYDFRLYLQVLDGQPLSQRDMLETQRRLYDLGLFNRVDIAVQNPDGDLEYKNVLLNVEEAKRYTFNYGVGFEVSTGTGLGSNLPQGSTGFS